jgi:hypothetical protein
MADIVDINLSETEKRTLQAIRTVFAALGEKEEPKASSTVIRVAGGWVRDKVRQRSRLKIVDCRFQSSLNATKSIFSF